MSYVLTASNQIGDLTSDEKIQFGFYPLFPFLENTPFKVKKFQGKSRKVKARQPVLYFLNHLKIKIVQSLLFFKKRKKINLTQLCRNPQYLAEIKVYMIPL